jgi:hypothetical protein
MGLSGEQARQFVEQISSKIEASKGSHIWGDYINGLRLIAQVVFIRSSGFILELLQNAEDAGLELSGQGEFQVFISEKRIKIVHNGKPFDEQDVIALCGVRSSKKPERGTLGYLGIGFKSVYKVTDRPEVYSGPFRFKFCRNYWPDPINTPWHVLPLWVDVPSEEVDESKTTFIIPFREPSQYSSVVSDVTKLGTELYLFLKWIKKVAAYDEVSGRPWLLENVGEAGGDIAVLKKDGKEERFKFFRRTLDVSQAPARVKADRLTQEYRANVKQRDISIAFALDQNGNLAPQPGGVYSFLPLGEERSGAKFPIQADFLVQPGREAINYEAEWNHWLVEEVAELCKEAIAYFHRHPTWKYQYLSAFEFTKSPGLESYSKLFGPKLIEPIEAFLRSTRPVPTADGDWGRIEEVIRVEENEAALKELVDQGLVTDSDLGFAFGGDRNLKVVDPRVVESPSIGIRRVGRQNLLSNEDFLERLRMAADAPQQFRKLYLWLSRHPRWTTSRSGNRYQERYSDYRIVLTSRSELVEGGKVWLLDFQPSDASLASLLSSLGNSRNVLHPAIFGGTADDKERGELRGFLTGLVGVQTLNASTVCREAILPKIQATAPRPQKQDLLEYTRYCKDILGGRMERTEIWVLTNQGEIRPSPEVVFGQDYQPEQNWETNRQYVPGLNFLSNEYLLGSTDPNDLNRWREFFRMAGVKTAPDNGVRDFAQSYAIQKLPAEIPRKLGAACTGITPVDARNFGYDLVAKFAQGDELKIEVKGQSKDEDIVLTSNETDAADQYQDKYYICVVSGIPEQPVLYMVKNPAAPGIGKKDKLAVLVSTWKSYRWV